VLRTAREAAAYAGLNPSHRQSGSSLDAPSRISRIGNATLRAALYFPALAAIRWNPLVLRQRLKDQGRLKPKQIVGAANCCTCALACSRPANRSIPTMPRRPTKRLRRLE
jgi:transposase